MFSKERETERPNDTDARPNFQSSMYPVFPGYQFYPPPWPYIYDPRHQPLLNALPYASNCQSWSPENYMERYIPSHVRKEEPDQNEYTVNSLRHRYKNSDESIEIKHVKVQKMFDNSPIYRQLPMHPRPRISVINVTPDGKVPPPRRRRNRKKMQQMQLQQAYNRADMAPSWLVEQHYAPHTYPPCPVMFGYMLPPPMYPNAIRSSPVNVNTDNLTSNRDTPSGKNLQQRSSEEELGNAGPFRQLTSDQSERPSLQSDSNTALFTTATRPGESKVERNKKIDGDLANALKNLENTAGIFQERIETILRDGSTPEKHINKVNNEIMTKSPSTESIDADICESDFPDNAQFEGDDEPQISPLRPVTTEKSYQWILKDETNFSSMELQSGVINNLESWLTEVSLWRAHLIFSLRKGCGLDQQDWETLQLLVHHPLCMSMKLSVLNAPRFCLSNSNVGVAVLRNALLYLITYGEANLRQDNENTEKKCVDAKETPLLKKVKGTVDILQILGYFPLEEKVSKLKLRTTSETTIVAKLTLDMLILSEEFRLYLSGIHEYPTNITSLFTHKKCPPETAENMNECFSLMSPQLQSPDDSDSSSTDSSFPTIIHKAEVNAKTELINDVQRREPSVEDLSNISNDNTHNEQNASCAIINDFATSTFNSITDLCSADSASAPTNEDRNEVTPENIDQMEPLKNKPNHKREDHIYEEIRELKVQRKAVKQQVQPPPLPPKTKKEKFNPDFKYYALNLAIENTSTFNRKKKRRAPMPPNFIAQRGPMESRTLDSNANPFNENSKPAGFIGRNPFYEDIDPKSVKPKNSNDSGEPRDSREVKSSVKQSTLAHSEIAKCGNEKLNTASHEFSDSNSRRISKGTTRENDDGPTEKDDNHITKCEANAANLSITPSPNLGDQLKILEDIPYVDSIDIPLDENSIPQTTTKIRSSRLQLKTTVLNKTPSPPTTSPPETPHNSPPHSPVLFKRYGREPNIKLKVQLQDSAATKHNTTDEQECDNESDHKRASTEERYEIPDVSRAEENIRLLNSMKAMSVNAITKEKLNEEATKSPSSSDREQQGSILNSPKKINRFCHSHQCSETYLLKSSTSANRLTSDNKISYNSTDDKRSTENTQNLAALGRPQSAPSSPRIKSDRTNGMKPRPPKAGASWSCLFCDCLLVDDSKKGK